MSVAGLVSLLAGVGTATLIHKLWRNRVEHPTRSDQAIWSIALWSVWIVLGAAVLIVASNRISH